MEDDEMSESQTSMFWASVVSMIGVALLFVAGFGALEVLLVLPLALCFLRAPPAAPLAGSFGAGPMPGGRVLGLAPSLVLGLLSLAIFLCCVAMALPRSPCCAANGSSTARTSMRWGRASRPGANSMTPP